MPTRPKLDIRKFRNIRFPDKATEPKAEKSEPSPPPSPGWLSDTAAPYWRELSLEMTREGSYRRLYQTTLATYCELLCKFIDNPDDFGASRLTQMRLLAGDLGLTPSHFHRVARTPGR